jgi:legumain
MVGAYEQRCGRLDQYTMRHTRFFANLCNAGLLPNALGDALRSVECLPQPRMTAASY